MNTEWNIDELPPEPSEHSPVCTDSGRKDSREPLAFGPYSVYYDSISSSYLVDTGGHFQIWSRRAPVEQGILRWMMNQGVGSNSQDPEKEARRQAAASLRDRELDGAVEWAGAIAGHKRGVQGDISGRRILITTAPQMPAPEVGPTQVLDGLLLQAFPDDEHRAVFMGWLATRYRAVRSGVHIPGPMLVLAGDVKAGKSLLAWLAGQVLGGRVGFPYAAWCGGHQWNDDLVGCELLLIDDAVSSTDIRHRRNLGAMFKEAVYAPAVQLRKRHTSSTTVRPVWSVMVCCNSTPEALRIIPPLDADLVDKVSLLRVARITPPVCTSSPEGRRRLQEMIRAELPAFAARLVGFEVPARLHDNRSGILAYRDPDLAAAVDAESPESRLEELIRLAIQDSALWRDLPVVLTASEVESRLTAVGSSVRDQARGLFTWGAAAGTYLGKLARNGSGHVEFAKSDGRRKINRYRIKA